MSEIKEGYRESKSWALGFLEANSSFIINIALRENKSFKYIEFKPMISILTTDLAPLEYIQHIIGIDSNSIIDKKKQKNSSKAFALNIQNYDDIKSTIQLIESRGEFYSNKKTEIFNKFKETFELIKKDGHRYEKWSDNIEKLLDKKFELNKRKNLDKIRMSKENWIKKIQNHLES